MAGPVALDFNALSRGYFFVTDLVGQNEYSDEQVRGPDASAGVDQQSSGDSG